MEYRPDMTLEEKKTWQKSLMSGFTTQIYKEAEERDLETEARRRKQEKTEREQKEKMSQAAEEMKDKPMTPWQKHLDDAEKIGYDTRDPETVAMGGERRTDEEVGR